MRAWSVPLGAIDEFQHASPTGGFVMTEWRRSQDLTPGTVVEVAGQWRAVRSVACGIGYWPTSGSGWRVGRTTSLVWTWGALAPHVAKSGFRTRLDMRVDGGTSPPPPVSVGAEVLVYDRYGATCQARVTAIDGDRLAYLLAGGDLEHSGALVDVAEVLRAGPEAARP